MRYANQFTENFFGVDGTVSKKAYITRETRVESPSRGIALEPMIIPAIQPTETNMTLVPIDPATQPTRPVTGKRIIAPTRVNNPALQTKSPVTVNINALPLIQEVGTGVPITTGEAIGDNENISIGGFGGGGGSGFSEEEEVQDEIINDSPNAASTGVKKVNPNFKRDISILVIGLIVVAYFLYKESRKNKK